MFTADDNDGSDFGNGATESGEPCGQQCIPANIHRRPDSSAAGSTVNQPPAPFRTGTKHKQKNVVQQDYRDSRRPIAATAKLEFSKR
jgi:hypothetical protein